jgi:glutamyl-tRNA synthetase
VDDARQGITDVVRGDDLLPSAARQQLLYRALGVLPPRWWHLPLVLGPDGRRLAKRNGDTRLETYRQQGVSPQRILGLMGFWCGLCQQPIEMTLADFLTAFQLDTLPRAPVVFSEDEHAWLMQ